MEYCNKSHVIQTLPFNLTEVTFNDKHEYEWGELCKSSRRKSEIVDCKTASKVLEFILFTKLKSYIMEL